MNSLKRSTIFLGGFFLLSLSCCEKKLFHRVNVKGRILNYYTGQPISTTVFLVSDNNFSGSSKSVGIGSATSNEGGYFSIEGKASKANSYFLSCQGIATEMRIDVKEDEVTDIGTLYGGSYTLNIKLTLISDSGKCFKSSYPSFSFPVGTNTVVVFQKENNSPGDSLYYFGYTTYQCQSGPSTNYFWLNSRVKGIDTARFTVRY
jgi:hypothetical protein